jgi:hypothetical protein
MPVTDVRVSAEVLPVTTAVPPAVPGLVLKARNVDEYPGVASIRTLAKAPRVALIICLFNYILRLMRPGQTPRAVCSLTLVAS